MKNLDQLICDQEDVIRAEIVKLNSLHREREPAEIKDYKLKTLNGEVALSELFDSRNEMIVIHNMGKSCRYCALWADGFNGYYDHIISRAAFIVVSNDSPSDQAEYRTAKKWNFPMYSVKGTTFSKDLGFYCENDKLFQPGVSYLKKDSNGKIWHTTNAGFGPGDLFSSFWHLMELLPNGVDNFVPEDIVRNQETQLSSGH